MGPAGPVGGPLSGRRVVVTRARAQATDLVDSLEDLGVEVVLAPAIEFAEPSDGGAALRAAISSLDVDGSRSGGRPDWILFTSANAVRRFVAELLAQSDTKVAATRDGAGPVGAPAAAALHGIRVAVIGSGTRDAATRAGLGVDLVPERFVAEGLLEVFPDPPPGGGRVLLPRAEVAREVLPETLRERGWTVDVVSAYRTVPATVDDSLRDAVARADVVCFASASSVSGFMDGYGSDVPPVVAAIGPITAERAREQGLEVSVLPDEHTIAAMVEALAAHFANHSA